MNWIDKKIKEYKYPLLKNKYYYELYHIKYPFDAPSDILKIIIEYVKDSKIYEVFNESIIRENQSICENLWSCLTRYDMIVLLRGLRNISLDNIEIINPTFASIPLLNKLRMCNNCSYGTYNNIIQMFTFKLNNIWIVDLFINNHYYDIESGNIEMDLCTTDFKESVVLRILY